MPTTTIPSDAGPMTAGGRGRSGAPNFGRGRGVLAPTGMRLGVFAKVGPAFGVLLLAFAGYATFTLLSVHRARQGVVANEAYLELQGAVDAAWKSVNDFAPSLGRAGDRLRPNLPPGLRSAGRH